MLRDIGGVLQAWRDENKDPPGLSPKEQLQARMHRERNALATISWLLVGRSLDEIKAMGQRP